MYLYIWVNTLALDKTTNQTCFARIRITYDDQIYFKFIHLFLLHILYIIKSIRSNNIYHNHHNSNKCQYNAKKMR